MNKYDIKINSDIFSVTPLAVTPTPSPTQLPPSPSPTTIVGQYSNVVLQSSPSHFWRFAIGETESTDLVDGSLLMVSIKNINAPTGISHIRGGIDELGVLPSAGTFGYPRHQGETFNSITQFGVELAFCLYSDPDSSIEFSPTFLESELFSWYYASQSNYSVMVAKRHVDGGWSEQAEYDLYLRGYDQVSDTRTLTLIHSNVPHSVFNHIYFKFNSSNLEVILNGVSIYNTTIASTSNMTLTNVGGDSNKAFSCNIDAVAIYNGANYALTQEDFDKRVYYIRSNSYSTNLLPPPSATPIPTPTPTPTQGIDFAYHSSIVDGGAPTHRWLMDTVNPVDIVAGNNLTSVFNNTAIRQISVSNEGLNGASVDLTATYPYDNSAESSLQLQTPINLSTYTNGFSYGCWVNIRKSPLKEQGYFALLGFSTGQYITLVYDQFGFHRFPNGQLIFNFFDSTTNYNFSESLGIADSLAGAWLHIFFTVDSGNNFKLYFNGQLVSSHIGVQYRTFTIDKIASDAFNQTIDGKLEDIVIYDYALTPETIMSQYIVGSRLLPPPSPTPSPTPTTVLYTQPTPTPTPTPSYAASNIPTPFETISMLNPVYSFGENGSFYNGLNEHIGNFNSVVFIDSPFESGKAAMFKNLEGGFFDSIWQMTNTAPFSYQYTLKIPESVGFEYGVSLAGWEANNHAYEFWLFKYASDTVNVAVTDLDYNTQLTEFKYYDITAFTSGSTLFYTFVYAHQPLTDFGEVKFYINSNRIYVDYTNNIPEVYGAVSVQRVAYGDSCILGHVYQYDFALTDEQVFDTFIDRWPDGVIPQQPPFTPTPLLGRSNLYHIDSRVINPSNLNVNTALALAPGQRTPSDIGFTAFYGYEHLDSTYVQQLDKHISLIGLADNKEKRYVVYSGSGDVPEFSISQFLVHYYGRDNITVLNTPIPAYPAPEGFAQQERLAYVISQSGQVSEKTPMQILAPFPTPTLSYDTNG